MKAGDDAINLHEHSLDISTDVEEIGGTVSIIDTINYGNCLRLTAKTDISMYEPFLVARKGWAGLQQWNSSERNCHFTINLQTTLQTTILIS